MIWNTGILEYMIWFHKMTTGLKWKHSRFKSWTEQSSSVYFRQVTTLSMECVHECFRYYDVDDAQNSEHMQHQTESDAWRYTMHTLYLLHHVSTENKMMGCFWHTQTSNTSTLQLQSKQKFTEHFYICMFVSCYIWIHCREKCILAVEYKVNFHKCVMKMASSTEKQLEIFQQTMKYKEKLDSFSMAMTIDSSLKINSGKRLSTHLSSITISIM